MHTQPTGALVYVGTYTRKGSKGIYIYRMDAATGTLTPVGTASEATNPSFLTIDPQRRYLYAVNETMEFDGQPGGGISAFAIDPGTGALTFINSRRTHGGAPCHASVDQTGRVVYAANYMGGNAAAFPVRAGGGLDPASAVVQHAGSGPNPRRQQGPHAHSITLDPANRFAFVADLGLARTRAYTYGETVTVTFNVSADLLSVPAMPSLDRASSDYVVKFAEAPYRAELIAADFGGVPTVDFDGYGTPSSGGSVVVRVGSALKTVVLDADTGKAEVQ